MRAIARLVQEQAVLDTGTLLMGQHRARAAVSCRELFAGDWRTNEIGLGARPHAPRPEHLEEALRVAVALPWKAAVAQQDGVNGVLEGLRVRGGYTQLRGRIGAAAQRARDAEDGKGGAQRRA
jgi:hypothetical protein